MLSTVPRLKFLFSQDKKYLVYVDTNTNNVKQSGARVTYFMKGHNDGIMVKLDTNQYNGERYWVVGCIGGEGQYTYFEPHTNFFNNDPRTELTKS